MGLWEKKRLRNFYIFVQDTDLDDPKTWKDIDFNKMSMREVYKKYKLEDNTIDFLGHSVALYRNDDYLDRPAMEAFRKLNLYTESIGKYGDSPFLYPIYGLGGIPESFSRLCAIHGGTYMLNTNVDEVLFGDDGKVNGIKSNGETARAPLVICDPSYVSTLKKTKEVAKVIRAICILDHTIPMTNDSASCQIIIPQKQLGRNSGNILFNL